MRICLVILFCCLLGTAGAQLPAVPGEVQVRNREAYQSRVSPAISVSKALFQISLREEKEWRRQAGVFLHNWLDGNPQVKPVITPLILRLDERNPGMRLLYVAGFIRHVMDSPDPVPLAQRTAVILGWMMRYYETQPGLKKDKTMKAMIRARDEGRLDAWIGKEMGMED